MQKKQNKLIGGGIALIALSFFFYCLANAAQVEVPPNFYNDYLNFLKETPAPTALNGGGGADLEEIVPPFKMPFSVFKFEFTGENKQSFSSGEKVSLGGKLSYTFKGNENLKKIEDVCMEKVKDEKKCKMPPVFEVYQFNNLGIFVQVWRKDENKVGADKGDFLVDEFYALENKNLANGESFNFNVNWKIPQEITAGDYYFSLYLNQDKSFDISGTPLAVFSEAKRFDFEIKNEGKNNGVELDKDNIEINGQEFAYRRPAPTVKGSMIDIEIPLQNLNKTKEQAEVKFELYRWGQTDPKNLIKTETQSKTLEAQSKEVLKYSFVPDGKESAFTLRVSTTNGKSDSISNIRFVIEGKNRGIFQFIAFAKDQEKVLPVFCLRNANWVGNFQGKVKLSLENNVWEKGGSIEAGEGRCFMVRDQKIQAGEKCSTLKAEIQDKTGFVTDQKEISVNCVKTESSQKITPTGTLVAQGNQDRNLILILVMTALALIGVFIVINNKKK